MKLFYLLLFVFVLMITGYLLMNDFSFDNISFSNYLISTLAILLSSCIIVGGIVWLFNSRRKSTYKDVMTIRQYYDYKSAR